MTVELCLVSEKQLALLLPMVQTYHQFEHLETTEAARESAVQTLLRNRNLGGIWFICRYGERVGYIALCTSYSIEFGGYDAFIDEFYIQPDSRGQGIGSVVLDLIKAEAKCLGIQALHLEVARTNQRAQQLYRRAHFESRDKYVLMSAILTLDHEVH